MDNLAMYNRWAQPPAEALKDFNNGRFKGTDINPMWRIRVLTEEYGECGFGWYCTVNRMWQEESPATKEIMVFCEVSLFVKRGEEWSKPIVGVGGNTFVASRKSGPQASDEAYKMAYTDALGIACKALGIGANVWWKAPDSKYMKADLENQEQQKQSSAKTNGTSVSQSAVNPPVCADCGCVIAPYGKRTAQEMAKAAKDKYQRVLCVTCAQEEAARREMGA